ncbi:hypothetical protein [Magnetococcus sp. PR-3]|uniref:hypothetical protein n=1 Tax=Magnetococcus sp. PR-3 TaxID=3120355 RepID=UPI002FCE6047
MNVHAYSIGGKTATLVVSDTTQSMSIPQTKQGFQQVLITNSGDAVVFMALGDATVTADSEDTPILPGSAQPFSRGNGDTHLAAICASGQSSNALHVTPGKGV